MVYQEIAANKRRSWLLVAVFFAVMAGLGWGLGQVTDYGPAFIPVALIVAIGMGLGAYYGGDKVALAASGAVPVGKEQNPYLYRIVENLSIAAGLPTPKVYVIPSPALNAFATGRDPKHASVAVTQGLIDKLENEELEGVLAHELSHIGNYDTRLMVLVLVLVGTIGLLADWGTRSMFFGGGRRSSSESRGQGQAILMLVGLALLILSPIIAQLIRLAVSRRREYLADASAALLTRYPEGLARALEKLGAGPKLETANAATEPLFIVSPLSGRKAASLFSTHPPIEERVKRLRGMMG
jgi:heat shock protein HtpX